MIRSRVGQGFDVHALVPGRRLLVGGVEIPHAQGLLGHSDADVLLHAITDAVLGATGLGDIGRLFPDTDSAHAGADSLVMLEQVVARAHDAGWQIVNADATVIAQAPRISPHVEAMRARIAPVLRVPLDAINIKGKTTERLGFAGRGEGIAAMAVVLVSEVERSGGN